MVATRVTRTVKFLSGISVCDHIVTPEWVEQSGRGVGFVEEGAFALCDRNTEEVFGMDLTTSLARAKGKKLLKVRSGVRGQGSLNYEVCDDTLGYLWETSPFLSPSFPPIPPSLLGWRPNHVCDTLGYTLYMRKIPIPPTLPSSLCSTTHPSLSPSLPPSLCPPPTGFLFPLHPSCPTSPQLIQGDH